jgi:hypothetical protein
MLKQGIANGGQLSMALRPSGNIAKTGDGLAFA